MEHAARGAKALDASDALTAVAAYTQALIQHPTSPDYFVRRSIAFNRLKPPRNELALEDAELAVLLGQKRAKREKIQAAQQRRVIALFGLGRYGDAAFVLETMLRWRSKEKKDKMEGDIWKAKIEQKLKALPAEDEKRQVTVKEYPNFELPGENDLVKMLKSQLKADGTFRFDEEDDIFITDAAVKKQNETNELSKEGLPETKTEVVGDGVHLSTDEMPISDTKVDTGRSNGTTTASAPIPQPATLTKIRHEWYQNAQSVNLTIYAKGVQKEQAEIDIRDDSVSTFGSFTDHRLSFGPRFMFAFHTLQTGRQHSYSHLILCSPLSTHLPLPTQSCRPKLKSTYARSSLGKSGPRLRVALLSRTWNWAQSLLLQKLLL
jgi:suppressor of G2 allele of SKP1